jgi:hypothetical protein
MHSFFEAPELRSGYQVSIVIARIGQEILRRNSQIWPRSARGQFFPFPTQAEHVCRIRGSRRNFCVAEVGSPVPWPPNASANELRRYVACVANAVVEDNLKLGGAWKIVCLGQRAPRPRSPSRDWINEIDRGANGRSCRAANLSFPRLSTPVPGFGAGLRAGHSTTRRGVMERLDAS